MPNGHVKFRILSGQHQGRMIRFALAEDKKSGAKEWQRKPVFMQPPSLKKAQITMVVLPSEQLESGAPVAPRTTQIHFDIDLLRAQTGNIYLLGPDGKERYVRIPYDGIDSNVAAYDGARDVHEAYQIICWEVYTSASS